jgi:hypothetical protein
VLGFFFFFFFAFLGGTWNWRFFFFVTHVYIDPFSTPIPAHFAEPGLLCTSSTTL